jgi:LysR family transcriptional regulator for bpeEF and oprC
LVQLPRSGIEDLLAQGMLEEVLPDFKPPPLPVAIVYAHNRHLSQRVRVFVDWLAEILSVPQTGRD